jgi:hypothetical protein
MDVAKLEVLKKILAILDKIYHTLIEQKPKQ